MSGRYGEYFKLGGRKLVFYCDSLGTMVEILYSIEQNSKYIKMWNPMLISLPFKE